MSEDLVTQLLHMTGASSAKKLEDIQSLWSGYGEISRFQLKGCDHSRIIAKHVKLPDQSTHPRGWNTQRSHQRKIRSYQVECAWYEEYSEQCDELCRVPISLGTAQSEHEFLMVMEDLSASGYSLVKDQVSLSEMDLCLSWLANFHATFMNNEPQALWPTGTYWHLATRPDELEALDDIALKQAAPIIDSKLRSSDYQTFVHGDAKLANFCFDKTGTQVAAVDFQYVGGGCGMKDLAYFIGSCLSESECERHETRLLDSYFDKLKHALRAKQPHINPDLVETDWRPLFAIAWADFHRFLKGWSPNHWKINSYSERITHSVIKQLC